MGAKKIFAIFACATATILGVSFAIFPFCEHKINWDVVAGKTASIAAGANCPEIAADLVKSIKYGQFAAKANARIALFHNKKFGEIGAKNFIRSCGKNFDFEEYEARLMLEGIAKEPDFASGFFKMKYMPQIRALKNPYLKAVLYYSLSLRTKNPDSEKYAKTAFEILKSQPKCENLTLAAAEIAQMAFEKGRPDDFFGVLKTCPRSPHYYIALFASLKSESFRKYILKNNKYDWSYQALETSIKMAKNGASEGLNIGERLKYTAGGLGYNWISNNEKVFNLPLIAYVAFASGESEIFEALKKKSASAESVKNMRGSKSGYINSCAAFFAAANELDLAIGFAGRAENPHQKLRALNSIILQTPPEKSAVEKVANELLSEK